MSARAALLDRLYFGDWAFMKLPTKYATVVGNPEFFTDDELAMLVFFSDRLTAEYQSRYGKSKIDWGDNFIAIGREYHDSRGWFRKRRTWEYGGFHSYSLPEAMTVFVRDDTRKPGHFVALKSGEIGVSQGLGENRPQHRDYNLLLVDGTIKPFSADAEMVAITADTIEMFGKMIRMAVAHRARRAGETVEVEQNDDLAALQTVWNNRHFADEA